MKRLHSVLLFFFSLTVLYLLALFLPPLSPLSPLSLVLLVLPFSSSHILTLHTEVVPLVFWNIFLFFFFFFPIIMCISHVLVYMAKLQLPLWALVSFGSYSLASIAYSLIVFRDCPEAHAELMQVTCILISYFIIS